MRSLPDQVRDALRGAAKVGETHAERVAFYKLADEISDAAALKLRGFIR